VPTLNFWPFSRGHRCVDGGRYLPRFHHALERACRALVPTLARLVADDLGLGVVERLEIESASADGSRKAGREP
jgi:hypothetical protein